jgi:ferritin
MAAPGMRRNPCLYHIFQETDPMMSKKLYEVLNNQVKYEFDSAYVYLSMAAHCESRNLNGFANWFKHQAQEEVKHAMKIYQFLLDRGEEVQLQQIDRPPNSFKSPAALFEQTLAHERKVTGLINTCYEVAVAEKDYPAQVMLHWFIEEQVEEEKQAEEVLQQMQMAGDSSAALLMMDKALGARSSSD